MAEQRVFRVALALEAQQFMQSMRSLEHAWSVFTAAIEQTQGALWNATVLGFQMSVAGRNWVENLYDIATQADVIRLKLASFEQAVRTSGESMDVATAAVQRLSDQFDILPDQVANAMGLLLRKGYAIEEATVLLERFADAAVNVGQDIADGMEAGASALLQERSILLNSVGIAENISTAFAQYADALNKSVSALTEAEKRQAMYNLVIQSTANRVGLAREYLSGFRGEIQKLTRSWRRFIQDFGKGVAAGLAPFITSIRVTLDVLNALPRPIRTILGMFATWASIATLLGGVIFLTVSNILRFVTTVKRTMADTIRAIALGVRAFREANMIITELGLASYQTGKMLDAMARSLLMAHAAANAPGLATFANNLVLIATNANAAEEAVGVLMTQLARLREFKRVALFSAFDKDREVLNKFRSSLDSILFDLRRFEVKTAKLFSKKLGAKIAPEVIFKVPPDIERQLAELGIGAATLADLWMTATRAINGEIELTERQLSALKRAIDETLAASGAFALASDDLARILGKREARAFEELSKKIALTQEQMLAALIATHRLRGLELKPTMDFAEFENAIINAFDKAGLKASIQFSESFKRRIASGQILNVDELLAGLVAIRAWPKDLDEATVKARNFADVVELTGQDLRRAMAGITQITHKTIASYELAMANMAAITRTTVQTIINLFERLRLYGAAAAIQDFIVLMTPASVTKVLDRAGEAMIARVKRLGTESGTALAYAFFSGLQVLDAMLPRFMRRMRIFQFFGKQSPYRFLTRGADDAAEAALRLADSATLLGRALQRLNKLTYASYGNLSLLGRVAKLGAHGILYLSDVIGFLLRGLLIIVRQVPIVGWLLALALVSEKTRTAIGSLGKSIIGVVIAIIKAGTDIVGALASLVVTVGEATGAFKLFRSVIAGIAFALETLAYGIRIASNKIREWALLARRSLISVKLRFAIVGRKQLEAELKQIDEQLKKIRGEAEANAKRYRQKIIDLFGPQWSKALEDEFNAVVDTFGEFAKKLEDAATGAKVDEAFVEQVEAIRGKVVKILDGMGIDIEQALAKMRQGLSMMEIFPDLDATQLAQVKGMLTLLDQIDSIRQAVSDQTRRGLLSSKQLISVVDGYIAYLEDLIKRMEEAGTRTEDRAQLENFINRLKKTKEALRDTAEELDKFIQKIRDSQASIEIELNFPETRRPFAELEAEIAKLEEQARDQFKGGDLIEALAAIHEYAAKKRLLIERRFQEEFQKLYEDNWARINDIIARGIEDELEKLRYERDNAIRETERRYDEQIKRYGIGTAEAIKLEEQKQAEIAALQALYAKREQQLIEDRLRKERQLFLDHYSEIRRLIDENWQLALDLYRKHLDRMNAVLEAQLNEQRDLLRRQRTLGQITPEEEALRLAQAERDAAKKRIEAELEFQRTRLRVAEESNKAQLDLTIKRLNLQRERELAEIERSVADERRRNRLIAETNRYYDRLIAEERKKSAYELYNLQEELATREIQLRDELAQKEREVEQRRIEQRIATYNRMAEAIAGVARRMAESGDVRDIARAIDYLSVQLVDLMGAGDEAASAMKRLREELDKLEQKLIDIASQSIEAAKQSIEKLGNLTLDFGLDDTARALRDVSQLVSDFGARLGELPGLLGEIANLPEEIRGNAYRAVAPMIDALRNMRSELDALKEQRVVLANLIATGDLPANVADEVRRQIKEIDAAIADALAKYQDYVATTVSEAERAVRSVAAEYAINAEKAKIDLERLRAETEATRRRIGNITLNVDVDLARARLRAAERNLQVILRYADQIADARKREELIAKAQNEVVQRRLELELRLDEARRRALRQAREELDVYEAQLALDMRRRGVYGDLADVVSRLATIDERMNIARQLGDERELVRLERERYDLNRRLEELQLNQAEAISAIALRARGLNAEVADAVARLATLGSRIRIAVDTGDMEQLRSLLDEQKRLLDTISERITGLARDYASMSAFAGRGLGTIVDLFNKLADAIPDMSGFADQALGAIDEWLSSMGDLLAMHERLARVAGRPFDATTRGLEEAQSAVENLNYALASAAQRVQSLDAMRSVARGALKALEQMGEGASEFANQLRIAAQDAERKLGPALEYALGVTRRLADQALQAAERFQEMASASRDAASRAREAIRSILDSRGAFDKLRAYIEQYGRMPLFGAALGITEREYDQVRRVLALTEREFARASQRIRDLIERARAGSLIDPEEAQRAIDTYVRAGRELEDLFGRQYLDVDLLDQLANALDEQGDKLDYEAKKFASIAESAMDYIAEYAARLQRRYGSAVFDVLKSLADPLSAIANAAQAIRQLGNVDARGLRELGEKIGSVFTQAVQAMRDAKQALGDGAASIVQDMTRMLDAFNAFAGGVRSVMKLSTRQIDDFVASFRTALRGLVGAVSDVARDVGSGALRMAADVVAALGKLSEFANGVRQFSEIGRSGISGFGDALRASLAVVVNAFAEFDKRLRESGTSVERVRVAIATLSTLFGAIAQVSRLSSEQIDQFAANMARIGDAIGPLIDAAERATSAIRTLFPERASSALAESVASVASAFANFAAAVEESVARILQAIARLESVQIKAPEVQVQPEATQAARESVAKIEVTNAQAIADAVGAQIAAAISAIKVEPIVNFNGQICESPELDAIAQAVMPQVMDAIRNELKRREALGQIQAAGAAC